MNRGIQWIVAIVAAAAVLLAAAAAVGFQLVLRKMARTIPVAVKAMRRARRRSSAASTGSNRRPQWGPGSRMLLSTVRMSVRPQKAIDRSSSFWMISRALVTPASPIAPSP